MAELLELVVHKARLVVGGSLGLHILGVLLGVLMKRLR